MLLLDHSDATFQVSPASLWDRFPIQHKNIILSITWDVRSEMKVILLDILPGTLRPVVKGR